MSTRQRWFCWWAGVLVLRGDVPITLFVEGGLLLLNLGERGLA
jgi:hypothetical protein